MATKHVKPRMARISRDRETEKLYKLEHLRNEAINAAARELAKVLGIKDEKQFWPRVMPQALFDLLENFEIGAGYVAAVAYVEHVEHKHPDVAKEEGLPRAWSEIQEKLLFAAQAVVNDHAYPVQIDPMPTNADGFVLVDSGIMEDLVKVVQEISDQAAKQIEEATGKPFVTR